MQFFIGILSPRIQIWRTITIPIALVLPCGYLLLLLLVGLWCMRLLRLRIQPVAFSSFGFLQVVNQINVVFRLCADRSLSLIFNPLLQLEVHVALIVLSKEIFSLQISFYSQFLELIFSHNVSRKLSL